MDTESGGPVSTGSIKPPSESAAACGRRSTTRVIGSKSVAYEIIVRQDRPFAQATAAPAFLDRSR